MIFNKHSALEGQHAFLGASKYHWINYDESKVAESYSKFLATQKGTELHDFAARCITLGQKLPKSQKTLNMYVNDAIGFKMIPEQPLFYSENCFAVTESPSGAEPSPIYADNIKYLNMMSAEDFGGTIEAYTYPDEFAECDGSVEIAPGVFAGQQSRKQFGLSYRTILGNDVDSDDYGYKLHLVYGCLASPSEKGYQTKNDSPEPIALSWEFSTTPAEISKLIEGKRIKPTAILTFDSTRVNAKNLAELEEILYGKDPTSPEGDDGVEPRLPLPDEVIEIMSKENP